VIPDPREISSITVYDGRLFDVELHHLVMHDGVETAREIIRHPGAVAMVPVAPDGRLLLVTQYRLAAGRRLLELPAGTLERGEAPFAAVTRELQEEVGMRPRKVEPIGGFFVAPGYTSEYIHLFLCSDLVPERLQGDEDEDIEVETLTLEEAIAAVQSGEICDAKSVIGILKWARMRGE
jgi:ADP-ribose pyrophosphatase